jgi:hypothetical protein
MTIDFPHFKKRTHLSPEGAPYLDLEEVHVMFPRYKSKEHMRRAIRDKRLAIPYYYLQGHMVIDREALRVFFAIMREESLIQLGKNAAAREGPGLAPRSPGRPLSRS